VLDDAIDTELAEFETERARSHTRVVAARFLRHRVATVALIVLVLMALASFFAPKYYSFDPNERTGALSEGPSSTHWFGTDNLGKDTYAQVARGTTKSMQIGLLVAIVATMLGVAVGAIAGLYGGWIDALLMRITDLFLVIPLLAVLIVLANRYRGDSGNWKEIAFVIAMFAWMYQARITRSELLALREREFVKAARALGASDRRIVFRHLLPNAAGAIIVNATLVVATAILIEGTLSFLGFGVTPPDISLGSLIDEGAEAARTRWWLFYLPGLWLVTILLCVNFVGDGLHDAIDPSQDRVRE